jgi:hypothetical protein
MLINNIQKCSSKISQLIMENLSDIEYQVFFILILFIESLIHLHIINRQLQYDS